MTSLQPGPLLALLALLLTLALGLVLAHVRFGPKARLRRRIDQVLGGEAQQGGLTADQGASQRRRALQGKLRSIDAQRAKKRGWRLREALGQAGLTASPRQFVLASLATGTAGALLALLLALPPIGVLALAVAGGLGLPRLVLNILINRRIKAFTGRFADAIDVIVRGIRSGLPVGECFAMIARELPDPVGPEFRLVIEGQKLGLTLEEALEKAVERVPTAELRYFAIVLAIQQSTGGNLAETLARLSDVLRARKRMKDKIKAMSGEAKASAGIIGSLPVIVGVLLALVAPSYIGLLFVSPAGHLVLFAGGCIMGTGIFVMRQMINFDI